MPRYPIIFITQIKHDYSPFPLVLSPTFGQLGHPLPEEPFFHIKQCNSLLEKSFNMFFYVRYVFSKLPFEFLFPFLVWTYNNSEVTLLSDIKQRPVFPDVQIFS